MFKLRQRRKASTVVKGIFGKSIPYEVRVSDGNWSAFFGKYMNQRWGVFDTDSCWCLGGAVNEAEDQLEWLWKQGMFSAEARAFFTNNGYIDSDGDFSLSERFLEIKGGNRQQGGTSEEAWQLIESWGCIPRSMLTYTDAQVQKLGNNIQAVSKDYFNPAAVTPAMEALGRQFKKYVAVNDQRIGKLWITPDKEVLRAALRQGPLAIGVPIPYAGSVCLWNQAWVRYNGARSMDHEVELYAIDSMGQYLIFDQYEPHLKILSADYYIPSVVQGVLNAVTPVAVSIVPQPSSYLQAFWTAVNDFWNGRYNPFPVGKR